MDERINPSRTLNQMCVPILEDAEKYAVKSMNSATKKLTYRQTDTKKDRFNGILCRGTC